MPLKYIVLATPNGEGPVVFPASFQHAWVASLFTECGMTVVAAGFCEIGGAEGVRCWGRSSSLGIASRPEADAALIRAHRQDG